MATKCILRRATYAEFVDDVSHVSGFNKADVKIICDAFIEVLIEYMKAGLCVPLPSLGSFFTKVLEERIIRSPSIPNGKIVPARRMIIFKQSSGVSIKTIPDSLTNTHKQ
jgi:nucleoid DNA-binding protein